jgi:hypothetical protein
MLPKRNYSVPLFEKDDCMDAGGRVTHGAVVSLDPPFSKGEAGCSPVLP